METGIRYELDTPLGTLVFEPDGATMGLVATEVTGLAGAPLRTASDPAPMADGLIAYDSYDSGRFPVINGYTKAFSNLAERRLRLDQLVAACHSIRRSDGILRWYPTGDDPRRLTVRLFGQVEVGNLSNVLKSFQIPLIAEDPRIYSDDEIVHTSGFIGTQTNIVACNNEGTVPTLPIVTLTGPINAASVLIRNLTYGTVLRLKDLSLAGGAKLEIDFRRGYLHTPGAFDSLARFMDFASDSQFWALQPGSQQTRVECSSAPGMGALYEIKFRHAYA